MGLSENRLYSQTNSHLIGIMISKTIGFRGTLFSDTPIYIMYVCYCLIIKHWYLIFNHETLEISIATTGIYLEYRLNAESQGSTAGHGMIKNRHGAAETFMRDSLHWVNICSPEIHWLNIIFLTKICHLRVFGFHNVP